MDNPQLKEYETEITKFPSDPKIFGPGVWFVIHSSAHDAIDEKSITDFLAFIRKIVTILPCGDCRNHATEYVNTHNPNDFIDLVNESGKKIGMFKYTWMFHNAVNERLGKRIIDFETAYHMYSQDEDTVCPIGCGE